MDIHITQEYYQALENMIAKEGGTIDYHISMAMDSYLAAYRALQVDTYEGREMD